jgi:hypothetical protein
VVTSSSSSSVFAGFRFPREVISVGAEQRALCAFTAGQRTDQGGGQMMRRYLGWLAGVTTHLHNHLYLTASRPPGGSPPTTL